jgi:signal transduction histidine kinase
MAVGLLLYWIWTIALPASPARSAAGALLALGVRAAAAALTLRRAGREPRPGWLRLWKYLGLGLSLWALADLTFLAMQALGARPSDLPSIPDLLRLAGFLAAGFALTSHPQRAAERFGRIRSILDNAILTLSVLTLIWLVLVRSALTVGIGTPIQVLWAAAPPAMDFVLLSLALHLLLQGRRLSDATVFGPACVGLLLMGVSDVIWGYSRLQQELVSGTLIEAGWMAGALLLTPGHHPEARVWSGRLGSAWEGLTRRIEPLLSISFTYAVVGMTVLDWLLFGEVDWVAVVAAASLSLLLVGRQGAVMGQAELQTAFDQVTAARSELEALNRVLEERVLQRTLALESTVADLESLNRELQELDRLKNEFVALVSHELRAPLTNIRSGIELVLGAETGMRSGARESLTLVHEETQRLSRLVEAILDLSALEAGRFSLHSIPLSLEEMFSRVRGKFPENLQPGRVRLDIPAELPKVRGDERGLGSVIFHLLDNALKYAPTGDIQVQARARDGNVEVTVSDCGPGIPDSELERVFEMFHRLDSRDSREVYGHGLGLHMARRFMQAMDGEIRAEPVPAGTGARFRFRLPIAEATSA